MKIIDLPDSLVRVIQSYLTKDDYHYLMNTSKTHFIDIKKQTIYFDLDHVKSLEYLRNQAFQELLLSKVMNGWKQIGIRLKETERIPDTLPINKIMMNRSDSLSLENLKHIENVIGIRITETVPPIPQIKELIIKNSLNLKNIENLSHLKTLTILHRNNIEDLTPLKNIENIIIEDCENIKDFSMFHANTQKSLTLSNCPYLQNLQNFRMIRSLTIGPCHNLIDISPLYGIYDLTLISCFSVTDISGLGNHHRLNLKSCSEITTGFESLFKIPYILLFSSSIEDLTPLRAAKSVTLEDCNKVVDISPLAKVSTVILEYCRLIHDLKPLENIPKFSIQNDNILIEETFKNKDLTLSVPYIKTIKDYSSLHNTQHLTIRVSYIDDFPMSILMFLNHLQSITLINCEIVHVNGLNNIPRVDLENCYELEDITGLGNNHSVDLRYCEKVTRVDNLASVHIVTIIGCAGIEDYSCLKNVPRLKVLRTGGEVYTEEKDEFYGQSDNDNDNDDYNTIFTFLPDYPGLDNFEF